MNRKALRRLMIALGLAVTLAASIATLQIVSAQGPAGAGPAGIQGLGGPKGTPGDLPDPHLCPGCPTQSADVILTEPRLDPSLSSAADSVPGVHFVHVATTTNITLNWTYIDHPLTNNNPDAIVFVTQNWNPGGGRGTYNDHAIGVWYDGVENKWAVFNQDIAAVPEGAAFNVLIPDTGVNVFVHQATVTNTGIFFEYQTYIKHFLTDNNRYAILFVTNNWNPGGGTGTYNDHSIGVLYNDIVANNWTIFNQCYTNTIPIGASFNVLIPETDASVFVHQATVTNTVSNYTHIDHPLTNDNPNALVFVTQNGQTVLLVTFNDHHIGVWYDDVENKWAIFNQDGAAMPEGAAFSVLIRAGKVYLPIVLH